MRTFLLSTLTLCSLTTFAQSWTFGPKVNLGLSQTTSTDETIVQDVLISSGQGSERVGVNVGGFARCDQPRWYTQAEATWGRSRNSLFLNSPTNGQPYFDNRQRYGLGLSAGVKLLPWLRLGGGLNSVWMAAPRSSYPSGQVDFYQRLVAERPTQAEFYRPLARFFGVMNSVETSLRRHVLEGQLLAGVDLGGLTVDLAHTRSLTPLINGITHQNQTSDFRQYYGYWSLTVGYRLFPATKFLLQPRTNRRAYERVKRDIPFYRHEIGAGLGVTGDDFGGSVLYENRYTHYFKRRFGLTTTLGIATSYEDDRGFLPQAAHAFQLSAMLRALPLYSRRHTVGVSAGPVAVYRQGVDVSVGTTTFDPNGQELNLVYLRPDSRRKDFGLGLQAQVDYLVAVTDRIPVGLWLRLVSSQPMQFAALGIQAGYRL